MTWSGGWALAVPSNSRRKQAAWDFVRFCATDAAYRVQMESGRQVAEAEGRIYLPAQYPKPSINRFAQSALRGRQPRRAGPLPNGQADLRRPAAQRPLPPGHAGRTTIVERADPGDGDGPLPPHDATAALEQSQAIVQRQLDVVLQPPRGRPIESWGGLYAAYAVMLLAFAVVVSIRFFGGGSKVDALHKKQWFGGLVCASPWIVGFVIFGGGPMLFSLLISFCDYDILNAPRFVGLGNYHEMFAGDQLLPTAVWNTVYMVIGVPLGMAVGLALALLLNQKVRGIAAWRTLFYLPAVVPMVVSSVLWVWILNPQGGLINLALELIGVQGPRWLQAAQWSKPSLILMGLWTAGSGMIVWLAGLNGIPQSLYEAASIDGATKWRQFLSVTLPQLTPYIFFNMLMGLIGTFQIFGQAFVMTGGGPENSTLFYVYHLFNNAFRYGRMGYASAMAWGLFAVVLGLTVVQLRPQPPLGALRGPGVDMKRIGTARLLVYATLLVGAIVFAFPFVWMASSSVKVDRELYAEDLTILPVRPSAVRSGPWVDHAYYADLPGAADRQAAVLPALETLAGPMAAAAPGIDAAELKAQVARGLYQRLSRTLPPQVWAGPVDALVVAAAPVVTQDLVDTVAYNVTRRLSVGPLRVGFDDDSEFEPGHGLPISRRWQDDKGGVGRLRDTDPGARRTSADVAYDFEYADHFAFTTDVDLPAGPARPTRLRLSLRPDDSWHSLSMVVETGGRRWEGRRDVSLANFDWQTLTWQWPSDEDTSLKVHNWVTLRDTGASPVTGDRAMRVTLAVHQSTQARAWLNKTRLNYDRVTDSIPFPRYLRVSLFLVAANVVLTLFASSFVSYAFARLHWPGRDACFLLMLATLMIPGQVLMIPHFLIWKSAGAFDTLTPLWLPAVFGNAFYVFMLYQFIRGIPPDLEEAARIDGCNFLGIYWHVILPLIKPSLAAIAIFTFMASWNDFFGPLLYIADQRLYPLAFGLYALSVEVQNSPTITMAAGVLMTVPVIVIFFAAQRYFVQGITLTGMKG